MIAILWNIKKAINSRKFRYNSGLMPTILSSHTTVRPMHVTMKGSYEIIEQGGERTLNNDTIEVRLGSERELVIRTGTSARTSTSTRTSIAKKRATSASINDFKEASPSSSNVFVKPNLPILNDHESVRTVSREGLIPLRHPAPDLQSLQGAYSGNVERLEQTAERLSLSSNIGEELRKLQVEQRLSGSRRTSTDFSMHRYWPTSQVMSPHLSTSSNSNSLLARSTIARSGDLSSPAYLASPRELASSPLWDPRPSKAQSQTGGDHCARLSPNGLHVPPDASLISIRSGPSVDRSVEVTKTVAHRVAKSPSVHGEQRRDVQQLMNDQDGLESSSASNMERPSSATIMSIYNANCLFANFDGVHIVPEPYDISTDVHTKINKFDSAMRKGTSKVLPSGPPSSARLGSFSEKEKIVYYPAPVPMMLNLPKKLSRDPPASAQDHQSRLLGGTTNKFTMAIPETPQIYDVGLNPGSLVPSGGLRIQQSMAQCPSHLRASLFFKHIKVQQDVQMKGGSAVATLDSILDASTSAPVSAFLDHPIAGYVGAEVYGSYSTRRSVVGIPLARQEPKNCCSTQIFADHRPSSVAVLDDGKRRTSSMPFNTKPEVSSSSQHGDSLTVDGNIGAGPGGDDMRSPLDMVERSDDRGVFNVLGINGDDPRLADEMYTRLPTTLLAELHLRKHEQKLRNRTATTDYPNGMRSTLLELDAVAQVQRNTRKQKHITLAWENLNAGHSGMENGDNEDTPLAILYPDRKLAQSLEIFNKDRPSGLIAMQAAENNEPLSQRRARLRGESSTPRSVSSESQSASHALRVAALTDLQAEDNTDEGDETLAERLQRLQESKITSDLGIVGGDFEDEVMNQLGRLLESHQPARVADHKTPNAAETLGQRRIRLQKKEASERNDEAAQYLLAKQYSMADISQARSVGSLSTIFPTLAPAIKRNTETQYPDLIHCMSRHTSNILYPNQNISMVAGFCSLGESNSKTLTAETLGVTSFGVARPNDHPLTSNGNLVPATRYTGMGPDMHPMMLSIGPQEFSSGSRQRDMINRWRRDVM